MKMLKETYIEVVATYLHVDKLEGYGYDLATYYNENEIPAATAAAQIRRIEQEKEET